MIKSNSFCKDYLDQVSRVLFECDDDVIYNIVNVLLTAIAEGFKVLIFGNGGSSALASHFAEDLMKCVKSETKQIVRAISLASDAPLLTCLANDLGYNQVFSTQVESLADPGDIVFCISASGNSPNIIKAAQIAKELDATVVSLTGNNGGKLAALSDVCFRAPSDDTAIVEDVSHAVCHSILREIVRRIKWEKLDRD